MMHEVRVVRTDTEPGHSTWHRAECTCGFLGRAWVSRSSAQSDAIAHLAEARRDP